MPVAILARAAQPPAHARLHFRMVDYESVDLRKGDERIKWPRVVGAGWEKAAKLSESHGPWGLTTLL